MFKRSLLSVFLICLLAGCTGNKKNDWENLSLSGKVKQILEIQYLAVEKFGKVEKGDPYREEGWDMIMNFNNNGYYTQITQLSSMGDEVGRTEFLYNKEGVLVAEQNFDAEGGFSDKNTYSYDDKKRVTQIVGFNNTDNLTGSKLMEYDEKNNMVTISSYNSRGKMLNKEVRKVDKNGFPLETKIYNAGGDVVNYRKEKFNKNGLREELLVLSSDETLLMKVIFKYDKKNNLLSQEGVDGNGEAFLPVRYEYLFDDQGNWTKRIEYMGDKPTYILERQFEYYQ